MIRGGGRRAALAAGLFLGVAVVALAAVLSGSWLADRAAPEPPAVVTKVDQVGDRLAVVQVDGAAAAEAADASHDTARRWTLGALALALIPVGAMIWVGSGRLARLAPSGPESDGDHHEPDDHAGRWQVELAEQREHDRRQLQEVVHELRTPLAVAVTNLELAATTPGVDDELEQQLAAARRGLERLARTVDDLAAHGGLAVADDGQADLAHEVRALATEHAAMARTYRVTIEVAAPERLVVTADRSAVHTAVSNVLTNALRLAPVGSVVRLATGVREDGWAWIAVRDEGPGLADADHERAFHRYWRGRYDQDRDQGDGEARGLGLTIARQLTEAQGGHVTVRSAVGVGSTFVVWLPASTDARTEDVVADDGIHHRVDPLGPSFVSGQATSPVASDDMSAPGGVVASTR